MDVTIVQLLKQLMNPFDPDMASMIHNEMRKHGIKLVLGYTCLLYTSILWKPPDLHRKRHWMPWESREKKENWLLNSYSSNQWF